MEKGDRVKAISQSCGWGGVKIGDIGTITSQNGNSLIIDFPNHHSWSGCPENVELLPSDTPIKQFEVGKWYQWIGPKKPIKWGCGDSSIWETGKARHCDSRLSDGATFDGLPDRYSTSDPSNICNFREVPAPSVSGEYVDWERPKGEKMATTSPRAPTMGDMIFHSVQTAPTPSGPWREYLQGTWDTACGTPRTGVSSLPESALDDRLADRIFSGGVRP
jgi:hypothetical protein